jgi:hypothetical protein
VRPRRRGCLRVRGQKPQQQSQGESESTCECKVCVGESVDRVWSVREGCLQESSESTFVCEVCGRWKMRLESLRGK